MKLFYTIALLLCCNFGFAQDHWKLIYENDLDGNAVTGSFDELVSSIRNGNTIRIYFKMGRANQPKIFVEHTALVKFTTVLNSPTGQYVTAQIDPIVGQVPNYEKGLVQLKENLEWSLIASSNGKNDTMTRNMVTGEIVSHRLVRWGTKWFVEVK